MLVSFLVAVQVAVVVLGQPALVFFGVSFFAGGAAR